VAAVALIKAVDGYDSSRPVPFVGYAVPFVLGSLKRHFRDATWAMRVPRSTQELSRRVGTATAELSQLLLHTPTRVELAAHLQVDVASLAAAVAAGRNYRLASLDSPPPGADGADFIGDLDPHYADVVDYLSLQPLVAALPLRERRILTMRFYEHMSQTQIAAEVGLSQMHVSRLLRKTLTRLRAAIAY
jgi:RNA polymerase sigma-B factor